MKWIVQTDGGSPRNPGPAAYAFVIKENGISKVSKSGYLSSATNNRAEYAGVTAAAWFLLNRVDANDLPAEIEFWSDSQIIVYQLIGKYRVLDVDLRKHYEEAAAMIAELRKRTKVTINWFRRELNQEADELCNEVLAKHGVEIVSKKRKVQKELAALS